jgi:hypothetical protein
VPEETTLTLNDKRHHVTPYQKIPVKVNPHRDTSLIKHNKRYQLPSLGTPLETPKRYAQPRENVESCPKTR